MIDIVHDAFMGELKKIAAMGVYTPGMPRRQKTPKPRPMPRVVKAPRLPKPKIQEPMAVPGQAAIQTLSSSS